VVEIRVLHRRHRDQEVVSEKRAIHGHSISDCAQADK
jgi:hypothetical protein